MYLYSIKQNTELKNEGQIKLAFKEYENFMENFQKFNFFFNFRGKINEINYIENIEKEMQINLKEFE